MTRAKTERDRPVILPPKRTHIVEKAVVSGDSNEQSSDSKSTDRQTISKMKLAEIEKKPPRVLRPPPKSYEGAPVSTNPNPSSGVPPGPPIPPPPPPGAPAHSPLPRGPPPAPLPPRSLPRLAIGGDKVHQAPELIEFYQTLMKREAKKDTLSLISSTSDAKSNMIGEIQNKISFLLAVKATVETQGDFIMSLATEVRAASFKRIEYLVAFLNWLDEELSFLSGA
ncbi:Protein CHUP1, chloroplastic [Quillaja saponaria]|uniref:Protein CHUP1, chloroplastic n=1 Tax=Quillaja saponaria TaxID=32244 RepID=A0AAD7L9E8_QUISA|nr:Protein CHUP1, chloroplastic [Quillaja saponaria]